MLQSPLVRRTSRMFAAAPRPDRQPIVEDAARWSLLTRIGFRLAALYLPLYIVCTGSNVPRW